MTKEEEYRQNAEHAQKMADRAAMDEDRKSWLRVAAGWWSLLPRRRAEAKSERTHPTRQGT